MRPPPSPTPYVPWPEDSRGGDNTPCTLSDGKAIAPSQAADKRRGTLAGLLEPCSPANQACGHFLDAEFIRPGEQVCQPWRTRPPTTIWTIGRRSMMTSNTKQSTPDKKTSSAEGTSGNAASAGKGTSGRKVNPALIKPLQPSKELAAVVGSKLRPALRW